MSSGSLDPETFPQMTFTKIVLNFGLVPKGYQTSKHLYIKNLTDRELHWKIAEIRGEKDNFLISSGSNALNRTTGSLRRHEKGKITYTLQAKVVTLNGFLVTLLVFSGVRSKSRYFVSFRCPSLRVSGLYHGVHLFSGLRSRRN